MCRIAGIVSCISGAAALVKTQVCVGDGISVAEPLCQKIGGKNYSLMYNGGIYNTAEIKAELVALGHKFEGQLEAEVLLHAYAQWGDKCLQRINGLFAFAIFCEERQELFFARDRIGAKPFFYTLLNGEFVFASEIKSLFAAGVKPRFNKDSVASLIMLGPGRIQGSGVYVGIKELKPAECGYLRNGKIKIFSYWKLEDKTHTDSFEDTAFNVRTLLTDATTRQLEGERIGTFLSGGLDSSIITAIASRHFKEPFNTFSVDYEDNDRYFVASKFQPNKDNDYIGIMNDFSGCVPHKITLKTKDLTEAIIHAADARDLPGMADIDSSLLLLCREVSKHVTVALSGECADEIFGGYPWFTDSALRDRYGFPWAQNTHERLKFLNSHWHSEIDGEGFVNNLYDETIKKTPVLDETSSEERRTKEMAMLNFNWFMQTLLDRNDRMSVHGGLEVRVPFCDHRIVEYLYNVPWKYKYHSGNEKGLLRYAMKDFLPPEILKRKKSPYPKTHNPEYMQSMKQKLNAILCDPDSRLFEIVDRGALLNLMNETDFKFYGQLMNVPQTMAYFVQLEHLLKKYKVEIIK